MKKILVLALAVVMALSIAGCGGGDKEPEDAWTSASFKSPTYLDGTIYFEVKESWTVESRDGLDSYVLLDGAALLGIAEHKLIAFDYESTPEKAYQSMANMFPEYETISANALTLNGLDAYLWIYTRMQADKEYHCVELFVLKGDSIYWFSFTLFDIDKLDEFNVIVDHVKNSIN